jgi:D-sedoheptulose 7-phosphate isomerase
MLMSSATATPAVDKLNESFREKILRKCGESMEMKEKFFTTYAGPLEAMSRALAERFQQGGRLFTMGNGGSLCDALHVTVEFNHPIIEKRPAFPVIPLMTDIATMTAIGNDLDFSRVFVNQLRLLAGPGDVAMAFSTSGKSPNLIYALEAAREKQMLTVAFAGKDGGRFPDVADYCFIVPSYSIHRIQEVHATAVHVVWDLVHIALGAEDVT